MFQSFRFNGLVIAQLTYMATKKGAFCKKCVTLVFSEFDLCVGEAACESQALLIRTASLGWHPSTLTTHKQRLAL